MSAVLFEDQELRAHEDHHMSLRLWLRLLSCTSRIEELIRQNLRDQFGISLSRFDLMAQLERHQEGLTMGELSRRMMFSGGNITAVVDQLENEQLVQRRIASSDRRSYIVMLTAHGKETFAAMASRHEQWVIDLFGGLNEQQRDQLLELLGQLKAGVQHIQSTPSAGPD
jgi:DNA-binding MarR family transcriptional regulator